MTSKNILCVWTICLLVYGNIIVIVEVYFKVMFNLIIILLCLIWTAHETILFFYFYIHLVRARLPWNYVQIVSFVLSSHFQNFFPLGSNFEASLYFIIYIFFFSLLNYRQKKNRQTKKCYFLILTQWCTLFTRPRMDKFGLEYVQYM